MFNTANTRNKPNVKILYNSVKRLNAAKPCKAFAFLIVWVCLLNTQALAATSLSSLDQDRELPVNVIADTLQYSDQHDVLTAKGEAVITQGVLSIKADRITINLVTKETEAEGKVLLTQNGDTIECESFTVNLDTQVGVVRQAKIFIKNENLHINGQEVQKTGPNTYTVHDGTITTCDAKNPPWRIEASVIDVEVDGYAVARHPLLKVKGLPVMYLPAMVVPVKTKRQSGFLTPEIGYSNRSGYQLDNSFFWAINDQSDATFWLDTASRQGFGTGAEYRVQLAEETDAKIYGYFADEKNSYQDDRYRNLQDRNNERYYLDFEGQHYFDADTYLKADVSHVSDRQFYYDYGSIVNRSKSDFNQGSSGNLDKQESTVFFNKNWRDSNLLVNTSWYENLRYNDPYTVQRLPEVLYTSKMLPVKSTPLFYQVEAGYDNFWRDSGQKGQRMNLYPQLAMPMLMGGWLRFTPEVGMRGVQYFGLNQTEDDDRTGLFPTVNAQLATTFVRIFDVDGESLKKIRHTLEPGLEYEYVASDNQDEFPDAFDSPENYYTRHWAGYFIKNRFSSLFRDSSGELSEHEIGYVKIGQAFNFSPPELGLYYVGDRDETSTDIYTEVRLDLGRHFYFKGDTYYDPYEQDLRRYSILGRLSGSGKNYLSAEYRYWRDLYKYLEFGTYYHVTSWLAMFINTRYDYFYNQDFETDIGIEYHSQCWGIRVWHETDGGNEDTRSDSSVKAMFFVKGFGDRTIF
jgi:LPS-assembly protein